MSTAKFGFNRNEGIKNIIQARMANTAIKKGIPFHTHGMPLITLYDPAQTFVTFLATGPRSLSSTSKLTFSPSERVLNPGISMDEK